MSKPVSHHIMIDCETLGLGDKPPIVSIGVVFFSGTRLLDEWYSPVRLILQDSDPIDAATLCWWMQQSDEARQVFVECAKAPLLNSTLWSLGVFIKDTITKYQNTSCANQFAGVWSNGALADIMWLNHHFRDNNMTLPWNYKQEKCYRTIAAMYPTELAAFMAERPATVAHNALDDAKYQAEFLIYLNSIHAIKL